MKKCVMAFGSHADDHEGPFGGVMLRAKDLGYDVVEVMGCCNHAGIRGHLTPREVWEIRTREANESLAVLGVEAVWLDFKQLWGGMGDDRKLIEWRSVDPVEGDFPECCRDRLPIVVACEDDATIDRVARLFIEREPEVVLTHAINDLGTEHQALTTLAVRAWDRAAREVELGALYMYVRTDRSVTVRIPADTIVDVTPYVDKIMEAISKHVSQGYGEPGLCDALRRTYRCWGGRIGVEYAMGYKLLRGGPAAAMQGRAPR